MYLVDTNVISEPMKREPDRDAVSWMERNAADVHVSAVTVKELRYGIARMPDGKRKNALLSAVIEAVDALGSRVLPFDRKAADICGDLEANARAAGNNCSIEDLMIASTALSNGLRVVTRNTKDFAPLGVNVVNPFEKG